MVEAFAPNGADEALDVAIGLGGQDGRAEHTDAGALGHSVESAAELGVIVAEEELGALTKRGELAEPLGEPVAGRGSRGHGAQDLTRLEVHDDEDKVAAEPEVPDLEEVAGPNRRRLVLEERGPALAARVLRKWAM